MNLENKTYNELKQMAKAAGINTMQKKAVLIDELTSYYSSKTQNTISEDSNIKEAELTFDGTIKKELKIVYEDDSIEIITEGIDEVIEQRLSDLDVATQGYEETSNKPVKLSKSEFDTYVFNTILSKRNIKLNLDIIYNEYLINDKLFDKESITNHIIQKYILRR